MLRAGLLPAEQTTSHVPWRIRITQEVRSRFLTGHTHDFPALDQAAKRLGCDRQPVLHKIQRSELHAVQVISGRRNA
jgi:hypothetical protein